MMLLLFIRDRRSDMKKIVLISATIIFAMIGVVVENCSIVFADDEPYIKEIEVLY